MHAKKMSKGDKLAALFLAGIFLAGAAIGAGATALVLRDKPEDTPAIVEEVKTAAAPTLEEVTASEEPQLTNLGEFKLTAYCTCEKCCGIWADGITYTGAQATPGRTVAVDPDEIPLGSTVYIDGHEYTAEDIGGAIKGKRIDILFATHEAALDFGVKYATVSINK